MQRKCTIRVLDEVNCAIIGLHPDHMEYFYIEYGEFAPNYFFTPKFKLTPWDGKIHYFHKTGKTFVHLLEDIIPRIVGLGYKVKLHDKRQAKAVVPPKIDDQFFAKRGIVEPDTGDPWVIRDYQVEMINTLADNGTGVGIAGTGAGKTSMCAALALLYEEAANFRSIIIVPDRNLTSQTLEDYQHFGVDVGQYSGERKDLNHQHIVSTWQALKNVPKLIQSFDLIIVDECHGLKGDILSKLLNVHGKNIPYRFGVTATLPKEPSDAMSVRVSVGPVLYSIPAHELIDQGHLATVHIDVMQLEVDLQDKYQKYLEDPNVIDDISYKKFKDSYLPDWPNEKRFLQTEKERLRWIADYIEIKADAGKGNVLCLVNGVAFGKRLTKMMDGAVFVHGPDKMKVRKEIYGMFKDNDNLIVIATVNIASTGLDIKRIFNLIFIDIGKSFIRTIQSIGRGLRKAKDKDSVLVTDICSDLKYSKSHLRKRVKYYKEALYPYKKRVVKYK